MPYSQIVFIGHHKLRYLESIKQLKNYSTERFILIIGEDPSIPGEKKVHKIAHELENEIKTFWDVRIEQINKLELFKAVEQLIKIVKYEQKIGNEILFNTAGSIRVLSIAAYIVSCVLDLKIVTALPAYDENGQDIGVSEIIEIPILPIALPGKEQYEIINSIDNSVDSIDEIIDNMNLKHKLSDKKVKSERSRLSHHLKYLESQKIIIREKEGRNTKVYLTERGKLFKKLNKYLPINSYSD